jgi:ABC-2 type transport system permease protein
MIRVYWMETKSEFLKLARMRMYSLSAIGFPLMFYAFFGLAMGREQQPGMAAPMARYLLATYGAFGVMGATLYAFGAGLAVERGLGWLEVKRASPMPPAAYLFAKAAVSLAFGAIIITLLFTMGAAFGGVRMPLWQWLLMGAVLVAGGVPFCALGLMIGTFAGPNSAPATVNMIYLPMSFCAGLWIPFDFLPSLLQKTAPLLPAFHFSQVALAVLRVPVQGSVAGHIAALAGFTLVFGGVAWAGQTREHSKMYG